MIIGHRSNGHFNFTETLKHNKLLNTNKYD
jgi:hypothetical protein